MSAVIGVAEVEIDVTGDVEKIYQEQNRKAVVRLRRAEKAFALAEKELAEAVKVADALDVLADGRFGLSGLSEASVNVELSRVLEGYRFKDAPYWSSGYSIVRDFRQRFDDAYPVTEKALEVWAEQLVDLTEWARNRNYSVAPWRIWLRVSFADDVEKFVAAKASDLGLEKVGA